MNDSKVISVNPSQATLGALHPDVTERVSRAFAGEVHRVQTHTPFTDFFFGTSRCTFNKSSIMLALRLMLAGLLAYMFFSGINSEAAPAHGLYLPVLEAVAAVSCVAGLACRIALIAPATFFAFTALEMAGISPAGMMTPAAAMFGAAAVACIAICLAGSGWFSADALMYRVLQRRAARQSRLPLTYKAFSQTWR